MAAGTNRDPDAEVAFRLAGAATERVHVNDLIEGRKRLHDYEILMLPGGFSFGDDIASGKVLANKLKYRLFGDLRKFVADGKLVLGVCNGFQVMVKLGLLPGFGGDYLTQSATLTYNDSGRFEDRWVYLKVNASSPCVFTKGIEGLVYAPVCHGEGKFVPAGEDVLKRLEAGGQIVALYVDGHGRAGDYPVNPNGSIADIAGICDETGRIFGLMPHPEDHVLATHHPRWTREQLDGEPGGLAIFENAVGYAAENLI